VAHDQGKGTDEGATTTAWIGLLVFALFALVVVAILADLVMVVTE
jgi:hypothetical protein